METNDGAVTYCSHHVTVGFCLDCLREERDTALARADRMEGALREIIDEWDTAETPWEALNGPINAARAALREGEG